MANRGVVIGSEKGVSILPPEKVDLQWCFKLFKYLFKFKNVNMMIKVGGASPKDYSLDILSEHQTCLTDVTSRCNKLMNCSFQNWVSNFKTRIGISQHCGHSEKAKPQVHSGVNNAARLQ